MNAQNHMIIAGFLAFLFFVPFIIHVYALPAGPIVTYISNSTAGSVSSNRSQDEKGTITVITLTSTQQDYKWKAYVGNVSGTLALDDGTSYTIYDWALGTPSGEVYVSRAASVNWANVSCANESIITTEEAALGMTTSAADSINSTFGVTTHQGILVGTKNIANSTCRSIATYINDTAQIIDETSDFQELLLADDVTGSLVYATVIETDALGYNEQTFDFQLLVAENESSSVPTTYYFYVELG